MKKTLTYAMNLAIEYSKQDPYKWFYVLDKQRCGTKVTSSTQQKEWLISNGYEVVALFINGERIK